MVRCDGRERLGGEALAQLRGDAAASADVRDHLRVRGRAADRGHARVVASGGREEGGTAHVDHLERLVERDAPLADLGGERLDGHHDDVKQPDSVLGQLGQLGRPVAAREDPRVDGRMEGPDEAADERWQVRERRHREHVDPVREEVLPCPVRGVKLDVEAGEIAGERADPVAVRHR